MLTSNRQQRLNQHQYTNITTTPHTRTTILPHLQLPHHTTNQTPQRNEDRTPTHTPSPNPLPHHLTTNPPRHLNTSQLNHSHNHATVNLPHHNTQMRNRTQPTQPTTSSQPPIIPIMPTTIRNTTINLTRTKIQHNTQTLITPQHTHSHNQPTAHTITKVPISHNTTSNTQRLISTILNTTHLQTLLHPENHATQAPQPTNPTTPLTPTQNSHLPHTLRQLPNTTPQQPNQTSHTITSHHTKNTSHHLKRTPIHNHQPTLPQPTADITQHPYNRHLLSLPTTPTTNIHSPMPTTKHQLTINIQIHTSHHKRITHIPNSPQVTNTTRTTRTFHQLTTRPDISTNAQAGPSVDAHTLQLVATQIAIR